MSKSGIPPEVRALFASSDREYLKGDNGDRRFMPLTQQFGRALRREGIEQVGPLTFHWGTRDLDILPTFPAYPTVESRQYVCRQCRELLGTCSCFKPAVSPAYE